MFISLSTKISHPTLETCISQYRKFQPDLSTSKLYFGVYSFIWYQYRENWCFDDRVMKVGSGHERPILHSN